MSGSSTFALLIYRRGAHEPPPDRVGEALVGHRAVQADAAGRGQLHAVARLDGVEGAKTVVFEAGAHEVTDGPYIETKEWLVGFYLVDCADEAEAIARARQLCPTADHAIEVRPVGWRWRG